MFKLRNLGDRYMRLFKLLLVILFLTQSSISFAQDPLEGLSEAVEDARKLWNSPGLAAAIVKDGEVVFSEGFGVRARPLMNIQDF